MREKYESLSVPVLRDVAKSRGLKHLSGLKKSELVDLMLKEDEKAAKSEKEEKGAEAAEIQEHQERVDGGKQEEKTPAQHDSRSERGDRTTRNERPERKSSKIITADGIEIDNPELDSGISAHGILEVMPDGYGFILSLIHI